MPLKKLINLLKKRKTKYEIIKHMPKYTTQEIAACAHIPGHEMAKTVMIKVDGKMAMCVLPATSNIDWDKLKKAIKAKRIELAKETEFEDLFDDCEIGAMPPMGNMWNLEVYVAEKLTKDKEIAFNAGTHTELIKMAYKDYDKLVHPKVMKFAS